MAKEFFENLPSTNTPLSASRLNGLLNGGEALGNIVVGDVKCKNLFNKNSVVNGWLRYDDNVLVDPTQNYYVSTDYIPVEPNKIYTLNLFNSEGLVSGGIMFYDSEKNWISPGIPETQTIITFTTTSNTKYVRFVLINEYKDNVQLEAGTSATEFTPYKAVGYTSGSNDNGNWMKFDNGTMICWGNKSLGEISCSTEWGGLYQGRADDLITYPLEFTVVDHLEITAIPTTSAAFWTMMGSRAYETTGYSGLYFMRPSSATIYPFVSWIAIGKWK